MTNLITNVAMTNLVSNITMTNAVIHSTPGNVPFQIFLSYVFVLITGYVIGKFLHKHLEAAAGSLWVKIKTASKKLIRNITSKTKD